jgi:hypothetical protein
VRIFTKFDILSIFRKSGKTLQVSLKSDNILYMKTNTSLSVAYRGREGLGGSTPPPWTFRSCDKAVPNSQFRGKYIRNNPRHPNGLTKSNRIANGAEPLTRGLPPPDPRSLCLLSSTEFVEPPRTKFLGTPLVGTNSLCYHNCCKDGGTIPEKFGYHLV